MWAYHTSVSCKRANITCVHSVEPTLPLPSRMNAMSADFTTHGFSVVGGGGGGLVGASFTVSKF